MSQGLEKIQTSLWIWPTSCLCVSTLCGSLATLLMGYEEGKKGLTSG
jgi:hypothetical protein